MAETGSNVILFGAGIGVLLGLFGGITGVIAGQASRNGAGWVRRLRVMFFVNVGIGVCLVVGGSLWRVLARAELEESVAESAIYAGGLFLAVVGTVAGFAFWDSSLTS